MNKTLPIKQIQMPPLTLLALVIQGTRLSRRWAYKILPRSRNLTITSLLLYIGLHIINRPARV